MKESEGNFLAQQKDFYISYPSPTTNLPVTSGKYFQHALNAFHRGNYNACADTINKGIVFMKKEIYKVSKNYSIYFKESIYRLEYLSMDIKKGNVTKERILRHVFSETEASIASSYLNAPQGCVRGPVVNCNSNLINVSDALKQGAIFGENDTKREFLYLINDVENLRGYLASTSPKDSSFIRKQVVKIQHKLDDLNIKLSTSISVHKNDWD